jgi:Ni/Co efflux regulator RcnB
MREAISALVMMALFVLYLIAFAAMASKAAHAQDGSYRSDWRHERQSERRYYRDPDDRDDDKRGVKCLDPVRGLGTQWIGQEGALEAAKKDWMEHVRYDKGETYVDMTVSRDLTSRCSRVSIGEVVGQVTYRCEIWARPCRAPLVETEKPSK